MAFEYLRRKMKAIIWFVTIVFVGSIFFLAGGSLCMKSQTEELARRERDNQAREQSESKPQRSKDELDPTVKNVVARIRFGDKEANVSEGELNERLNLAARQSPMLKGIKPAQLKGLFGPSQLEELINFRLAELAAESARIDVSDIEKQAKQELADPDFRRRLAHAGVEPEQFVSERVRTARVKRIIDQVTEGQPIPEIRSREYYDLHKDTFKDPKTGEVKGFEVVRKQVETILRSAVNEESIQDYYNRHKDRWRLPDKVKVAHLVVDPTSEARAKATTSTPQELEAYYKENKQSYLGEPRVGLRHIFLDPLSDKYRSEVKPKEEDLRRFYESNKADFEQPEQIKVSRVLLKVPEKAATSEEKKIEERAKQILAQLQKGAAFENVARESSEDKKSAGKGGDLGMIQAGQMSPPFDRAAFGLKEGQLSVVFRDEEGFQVLKLVKREEKRVKPLSEVTAEITKRYIDEKARALCEEDGKRIAREAQGQKDFEAIARSASMAPSKEKGGDLGLLFLGENRGNKAVDEVGSYGYMDEAVQKAVSGMTPGKISEPVKSSKGYHVLKLEKNLPAESKPLAEVKADIAETLRARKLDDEARRLAREVTLRLKAGEPFAKLVREMTDGKDKNGLWDGLVLESEEVQPVDKALLADVDSTDGKLPAQVVTSIESLQVGEISEPVNLGKKSHFFQLVLRYPPRHKPLDDAIRKEVQFALNPSVTQVEVEKYFGDHKDEFQPRPQMTAEWLVFPDKETADEAMAKINDKPKAFDDFPKKSFTGEIRNPALRELLSKLKPGETSQAPEEKKGMGFLIARLLKQDAGGDVTLDKVEKVVRERVLRERKQELYNRWLSELKNQAKISKSPLSPAGL